MDCPCCSGKPFDQCCGPRLDGTRPAETPEALMRSRYTAYVRGDFDYILHTTDPQKRGEVDEAAGRAWMEWSRFLGLEVLDSSEDGNKGEVEFVARFRPRVGGPEQRHHERSRFRKQGGRWYFREGKNNPR